MLLALVSFWLSGTCGLIDLQVPRALCLVETWRTQGAAPHHTEARTREKVLAKKAPSLLGVGGRFGVHIWLYIPRAFGAGPTLRSGKEVTSLPDTELVYFFVLVIVQSHLAPRLYTWPSPTGSEEPSSRGVSYKERLPETLQCPGLNKHFLGVSQPWEEILGLCPFYSWICWASDHCVICPGSLCRSV